MAASLYHPAQPEYVLNDISFDQRYNDSLSMVAGGVEMLRVAKDGFYVRGVKIPADDQEAEIVYNAFKQFLTWSELNRR